MYRPNVFALVVFLHAFISRAAAADTAGGSAEVLERLQRLATAHPALVTLDVSRVSREGRPIPLVTLALPGDPPVARRPAVLLTAGLEAGLLAPIEVSLGALEELVRRRDEPAVRRALAGRALHVFPLLNPDGRERAGLAPRRESLPSLVPVDEDRDARVDEDGPEDLDGDGEILSLLVPDPAGPWTVDTRDPRLLRPAASRDSDSARFRLEEEGIDNDGDGAINEDGVGGTDPAINFPHEHRARGALAGPYPTSEPESRALVDFLLASPGVELAFHLGRQDNLGSPPEARDGVPQRRGEHRLFKEDAELVGRLGERHRKGTGLKGRGLDPGPRGSWSETAYFDLGVPCLAACLFGGEPPVEGDKPPEARWLEWNDKALDGKGFVPWKPLRHPQLGEVLLGGWRPFVRTDLSLTAARELAPKEADFLVELLGSLPHLEASSLRVLDHGDGLYEISLAVVNRGELPTSCRQGVFTRRRSPLQIELEGKQLRVLGSPARTARDALAPGETQTARWLALGPPGGTVTVRVTRRGFSLLELQLELVQGGSL